MKLIYRAKDIAEAHIVSGLLNVNGVETHVGGHYLQGGIGELSAMDFANVHVADEDVALANTIIAEYEGNQTGPGKNTEIKSTAFMSGLNVIVLIFLIIIFIFYLVSS